MNFCCASRCRSCCRPRRHRPSWEAVLPRHSVRRPERLRQTRRRDIFEPESVQSCLMWECARVEPSQFDISNYVTYPPPGGDGVFGSVHCPSFTVTLSSQGDFCIYAGYMRSGMVLVRGFGARPSPVRMARASSLSPAAAGVAPPGACSVWRSFSSRSPFRRSPMTAASPTRSPLSSCPPAWLWVRRSVIGPARGCGTRPGQAARTRTAGRVRHANDATSGAACRSVRRSPLAHDIRHLTRAGRTEAPPTARRRGSPSPALPE